MQGSTLKAANPGEGEHCNGHGQTPEELPREVEFPHRRGYPVTVSSTAGSSNHAAGDRGHARGQIRLIYVVERAHDVQIGQRASQVHHHEQREREVEQKYPDDHREKAARSTGRTPCRTPCARFGGLAARTPVGSSSMGGMAKTELDRAG